MPKEQVYRITDVANVLRVSTKTVYSMAQSGELPSFKVRGQWRFFQKDIEDWIEQQKQAALTHKDNRK